MAEGEFPDKPKSALISEWDDYFMGIAFISAMRSKDPKTRVGACIVNEDKRIVGTGYNGMPNGDDINFPWGKNSSDPSKDKKLYVCHAEMNAIVNKFAADIKNAKIYVGLFPCNVCTKLIIQSGIKEVIYYSDKKSREPDGTDRPEYIASKRMLEVTGIRTRQYTPTMEILSIDFEDIIKDQEP